MIGRESGSMIRTKMPNSLAAVDAGGLDEVVGTVRKNWRNMKMPVAVMIDGTMMPARRL